VIQTKSFPVTLLYFLKDKAAMNEDIAGNVYRKYYRKSDKLNAPENQNRESQDGYQAGVDTLGEDAIKLINEKKHLRAEVGIRFSEITLAGAETALADLENRNNEQENQE
jgi:hypothetical protein